MKKTILINSKEYKVPTINFGAICELEKCGVDFTSNASFSFIRGLVAYTIGCSINEAANEIEQHINNGGSLEDFSILIKEVTESDFFQKTTKKHNK